MEQEKPFKSIEVIDSSTGQTCKIACMSCIRGHRTTSCGIPVCRTKIFWTVKRPGRPSNSCTCRFGPTGRCQCVVAKSACPHKPKRGEKRSLDCRCDEQGRYCCILQAEHWDVLTALQRPRVDFHTTREGLEATRVITMNPTYLSTPAHTVSTPHTVYSLPNTPGPLSSMQSYDSPVDAQQSPFNGVPRIGMMGIGLPMGSQGHEANDVLTWDGQAPQAPRDYPTYSDFAPADNSMMPSTILTPAPQAMSYPYMPQAESPYQGLVFGPDAQALQKLSMAPQQPQTSTSTSTSDFDKLMEDYFNYQFPSAICQNCGLNGCTCKNCPAVMQNTTNGSWAQCCSRKHTRTADVRPPVLAAQQLHDLNPLSYPDGNGAEQYDTNVLQPAVDQSLSETFDAADLQMGGQDPVDISEFLMTDLERPTHGCCCGGDT